MRVLVTAGGTREPIDDVRVIANTSTGRLGVRIAESAAAAGHFVTLLHGVHAARPTGSPEAIETQVFDTAAAQSCQPVISGYFEGWPASSFGKGFGLGLSPTALNMLEKTSFRRERTPKTST